MAILHILAILGVMLLAYIKRPDVLGFAGSATPGQSVRLDFIGWIYS